LLPPRLRAGQGWGRHPRTSAVAVSRCAPERGGGPGRAARLLETFGSVEAVVRASVEDLKAVSGIGPHTAEAIRWAVEESEAECVPAAGDLNL